MSKQLPVRAKRATTIGKDVVKLLIKEPVREAVQEALIEEQIREQTVTDQSQSQAQETDNDGRGIPVKSLLAVVGLVGIILLARRIRSDDSSSGMTSTSAGQRTGTTQRPENNNPSHRPADND